MIGSPRGRTFVQRALTAEATKIPLWVEHSIESGINQVVQGHQAAALPGIEYTVRITHLPEDDWMLAPLTMKDGSYGVPTNPGLGAAPDRAADDEYRVG